ncbi:hypothetical protein [Amycolatopsis mediterranei]|uniref:Uncharacterized protein n=1 Tax=Amycolatopsis mediterranei (strain S699) TaxID=713604 RepID=A0A9R0P538_AMYMS|nr:hypothetical protein [Amycolatopsis mediterranei]AEK46518.1 hypothetical protein RAM_40255 [Amycolatopsis mediterranei S699]UZF74553.1 hypothetical protein ISP_008077 [Amycolatopsis mediterranei]
MVPEEVLAKSVTALLGPEHATPAQVRATAVEGIQALADGRATALELIAAPARPVSAV